MSVAFATLPGVAEPAPVSFPAQALLILEERLKAHQAEGLLDAAADVTELAIKILLLSEGSTLTDVEVLRGWPNVL